MGYPRQYQQSFYKARGFQIFISVIILFIFVLSFFIFKKQHRQYNCSMFKTQAVAQTYLSIAPYLDKNHDHIACNSN